MTIRSWNLREYKRPPTSPLKEKWKTEWRKPSEPTLKQMQMNGMRKVPITLAKIPEPKVLTDEELK